MSGWIHTDMEGFRGIRISKNQKGGPSFGVTRERVIALWSLFGTPGGSACRHGML